MKKPAAAEAALMNALRRRSRKVSASEHLKTHLKQSVLRTITGEDLYDQMDDTSAKGFLEDDDRRLQQGRSRSLKRTESRLPREASLRSVRAEPEFWRKLLAGIKLKPFSRRSFSLATI